MNALDFSPADVIAMERAAARAWPAKHVESVAGWQLRLSGAGARRANSVLPLDYGGGDVDAAIDQVEAAYRAQSSRSYFQVSSCAVPVDLDNRLAARGYASEEPCLLMARRLASASMPVDVLVRQSPTADWLAIYTELLEPVRKAAAPLVLADVPEKRGFLLVHHNGAPVTAALSVIAPDGIAVIECVATRSTARRSGGARAVMDALEAWSFANGAHTAALQVVAANTPARALYERRGYATVGSYHYRWKDVG